MAGRKIRSQLLVIVAAALLPLIGIAVWQWFVALHDARGLVTSQLRADARMIAESEGDPFVVAEHTLSFAASQRDVLDFGPGCSATLADALKNTRGILNFVRTDAAGRARCSVLPFTDGHDLSGNKWWRKSSQLRQIYLSEPEIGQISRKTVLIMALPVIGRDNQFTGTISAGIGLEQLRDSIRSKGGGNGKIVAITDKRGAVVLAPQENWLSELDHVQEAQYAPQRFRTDDGMNWTFVSVPLYRDQLFLVLAEPEEVFSREALNRIWPNLLLPLLAITLASAAIWVGTRVLILRWLNKLRLRTAQFAKGDFGGDAADFNPAPEELALFAQDLHHMASVIEAKEATLTSALDKTEELTREVNHRVKNNLQIINSLLSIQSEHLSSKEAIAAVLRARIRIAALGLIHRHLYDTSSLAAMGTLSADQLLSDLCGQLRASFRDRDMIALECQADQIQLSGDMAVPLALLIVEVVFNSFDHGFPAGRSGAIQINLSVAGELAHLCIEDNGVGTPVSAPLKLGAELVQAFAGQLGGKLWIRSEGQGTTVELVFTPQAVPPPIASPR
jgi:two-component sensor histidine kinase